MHHDDKKRKIKLSPATIAISHNYTDFDGLASTVAASLIFPNTIPIINTTYEIEVQRFISIYKDYLNLFSINEIDFSNINKIFLLDTQDISRNKNLFETINKKQIDIVCIDHHPLEKVNQKKTNKIKQYGSTMTILYEIMKKKKIQFTPIQATLFLLGIYEDTGSLTFSSTTEKDIEAVGYFLKNGGRLSVVSEFVYPAFDSNQKVLFNKLFNSIQNFEIKGINISISTAEINTYVEGVSFLAHKLMEIVEVDALFVVVKFPNTVLIIGRSKDMKVLNLDNVLQSFGGGGHPQAASAFIKKNIKDINSLVISLLKEIKINIKVTRKVEDFMSSPVKVVDENTSAEEALKLMLRYGYSGLPVIKNEKLVGIISKRDIGRISEEKLKKMSVNYYMSKNPITVFPEASLKEAERIMIGKDYGRLPVVKEKKLIGIITRSDLLRALYGIKKDEERRLYKKNFFTKRDLIALIKNNLPDKIKKTISKLSLIADKLNIKIYLVGGCVRDLILGYNIKDFDLLIEGDFNKYIEQIKTDKKLIVYVNDKFKTAKIKIDNELIFDIALARKEYYEYPAALPTVTEGSLREDLFRRDFTINTLAIIINKDRFGELIDYYNAYDDLNNKKIRIMHNLSFIEDPSRLFRAVGYEIKYKFIMDKKTEETAINAVETKIFERTSKYRILNEFISLLNDFENIYTIFKRISKLGILKIISKNIKINNDIFSYIKNADILTKKYQIRNKWFIYVIIIALFMNDEDIKDMFSRLKISNKQFSTLYNIKENYESSLRVLNSVKTNSEIASCLKNYSLEELMVFGSIANLNERRKIIKYLDKVSKIKLILSGLEIKALTGLSGYKLGEIIQKLVLFKYDGLLKTKLSETEKLKELVRKGI